MPCRVERRASGERQAPPEAASGHPKALEAARKLLRYCRDSNWAGYDPYDALNSRVFRALPILDWRLPRLVMTQGLKWMPFNLRPLLLVPKSQNPKGLALFISALLKLRRAGMDGNDAEALGEALLSQRSQGGRYWNWGYSFPWQTRTRLVPRHEPNLVCTVFAAESLLDLYEETHDKRFVTAAESAGRYLADELVWRDGQNASFCYPLPGWPSKVHNANFLGASLLCRIGKLTREDRLIQTGLGVARYSASRQAADGSWVYGEGAKQQWIDNFHTGFNLCALADITQRLGSDEFVSALKRGLTFYASSFFLDDGAPKYFHNRAHPLDVHSAAQSLITLTRLNSWEPRCGSLRESVFDWTMENLWDDRGFFCYQVRSYGTVRIPYMRWGEAWMLLALAEMLNNSVGRGERT